MIKQLFNLWEEMTLNKKILVITGSGIFTSNQLPIYHELQEINEYKHREKLKTIFKKEVLLKNPEKVWSIILKKREIIHQGKPQVSHQYITKLEHFFKDNFALITENIEGYHVKAGSYRIIELNGNIWKNKILSDDLIYSNINNVPRNHYNQILRPDIVLLEEEIERKKILQSHILAQQSDLILIIGSDLSQFPINEMVELSKQTKSKIIEINEFKQYCPFADLYLKEEADKMLPLLIGIIIDLEKGIRKYREV